MRPGSAQSPVKLVALCLMAASLAGYGCTYLAMRHQGYERMIDGDGHETRVVIFSGGRWLYVYYPLFLIDHAVTKVGINIYDDRTGTITVSDHESDPVVDP